MDGKKLSLISDNFQYDHPTSLVRLVERRFLSNTISVGYANLQKEAFQTQKYIPGSSTLDRTGTSLRVEGILSWYSNSSDRWVWN